MTRQPALEKRITVAWPMPRLAPVNSSVRLGALESAGVEVGMEWDLAFGRQKYRYG